MSRPITPTNYRRIRGAVVLLAGLGTSITAATPHFLLGRPLTDVQGIGIGLGLVVAGVGIILLIRARATPKQAASEGNADSSAVPLGRDVALAGLSILLTLLALEGVLWIIGREPALHSPFLKDVAPAPYWVCDYEYGCHFDASEMAGLGGRLDIINSQGFPDQDEFAWSPEMEEAQRILVLGDSFSYGASADIGKSWVETVESELQAEHPTVLWNTGIPGIGTIQELASLRQFGPVLHPDWVILQIFPNDLYENLFPADTYVIVEENGKRTFMYRYRLDADLQPVRLTWQEAYYQATVGYPDLSLIERLMLCTRVGTVAVSGIRGLTGGPAFPDDRLMQEAKIARTRESLTAIRDEAATQGSKLIVLLIPYRSDVTNGPDWEYQTLVALLNELSIPTVAPLDGLTADDYAPLPDTHWNNSGHAKGAQALLDALRPLIDSSD